MMAILAGLLLGIAGSLHCVAMCGPLVVALRAGAPAGPRRRAWRTPAVLHHLGRILTYGVFGLAAGLLGRVVVAGGFGRALSITAGLVMFGLALGLHVPRQGWLGRRVGTLVGRGLAMIHGGADRRAPSRALLTGVLNALLPCGLVYAALAAAVGLGHPLSAAAFMVLFGLGTTPLLLGIGQSVPYLRARLPQGLRLAGPIALTVVGVLLVWRGLAVPHQHGAAGDEPRSAFLQAPAVSGADAPAATSPDASAPDAAGAGHLHQP